MKKGCGLSLGLNWASGCFGSHSDSGQDGGGVGAIVTGAEGGVEFELVAANMAKGVDKGAEEKR